MNTNFRDNKHLFEGYLKGGLSKSEELKLVDLDQFVPNELLGI